MNFNLIFSMIQLTDFTFIPLSFLKSHLDQWWKQAHQLLWEVDWDWITIIFFYITFQEARVYKKVFFPWHPQSKLQLFSKETQLSFRLKYCCLKYRMQCGQKLFLFSLCSYLEYHTLLITIQYYLLQNVLILPFLHQIFFGILKIYLESYYEFPSLFSKVNLSKFETDLKLIASTDFSYWA